MSATTQPRSRGTQRKVAFLRALGVAAAVIIVDRRVVLRVVVVEFDLCRYEAYALESGRSSASLPPPFTYRNARRP